MHRSNVKHMHVLGDQNDNYAKRKSAYFAPLVSLKDTHSYALQASPIFIAAKKRCFRTMRATISILRSCLQFISAL
jgi:hypothetical protein